MAATMTKRAFSGAAQKAAAPARSRAVRVCCAKQGDNVLQKVQTVAATVAAAALLHVSPVSAGVVLEQPQLKKVFQDDGTAAAPAPKKEIILPGMRSKAAPAANSEAAKPAKKVEVASSSGGDIDPRSIALPGALVAIAGGAFALKNLDEDFEDFMRTASAKDSNVDGVGYETAIKGGNGIVARKGSPPSSKPGTKKVKAASKSKPSSRAGTTTTNPLGNLFGSKE